MWHHRNCGVVCTCSCNGYSLGNLYLWYTYDKHYHSHINFNIDWPAHTLMPNLPELPNIPDNYQIHYYNLCELWIQHWLGLDVNHHQKGTETQDEWGWIVLAPLLSPISVPQEWWRHAHYLCALGRKPTGPLTRLGRHCCTDLPPFCLPLRESIYSLHLFQPYYNLFLPLCSTCLTFGPFNS